VQAELTMAAPPVDPLRRVRPPRQRPLSTLRNSRHASGPALLFTQAEIGVFVRGVKAGKFDYPT